MRFSLVAAALAGASAVSAQALNATYVGAILQALTAANLTSLAGAAQSIANTTEGVAFLSKLAGTNKTLLAPSNEAFAAVPAEVAANTTLLTQILSYHVLNTAVTTVPTAPAHGVVRSLYASGHLPANRTNPVVLTSSNSTGANVVSILEATSNATVLAGPVVAANFHVYVIDTVLTLPPTISELAPELFPSLAGVLGQVGIVAPLEATRGVTIFAPNDAAIAGVASALGTLNATSIATVLGNHVINGTAVYSTLLTAANYTSASGEAFRFTSNATGTFVTSGASTARIVQSDIIVANGVIHLIDGVLVNAASNPSAAASAASAAVVAATATSASAAASGSVVATTTARSAGVVDAKMNMGAMVGGVLVSVVGVVVGGLLL